MDRFLRWPVATSRERIGDAERSHATIAWIGRLYTIEKEAREGSSDGVRLMTTRAERSRPTLESFHVWLEGEARKVLPRSPIDEAITYTRSNRVALSRYLESPYLSIDNNAMENAIRPIRAGLEDAGTRATAPSADRQRCRRLRDLL